MFSIAMGANYSFEFISTETYAPQFIGHNNVFLNSVRQDWVPSILPYKFWPIFLAMKQKKRWKNTTWSNNIETQNYKNSKWKLAKTGWNPKFSSE